MALKSLGWYSLLAAGLAGLGALWWPQPPHESAAPPRRDAHAHEEERSERAPAPFLALEAAEAVEVIAAERKHRFEKNERGEWILHAHRHAHGHADAKAHRHADADRDAERWRGPMRLLAAMRVERRLGPRAAVDLRELGLEQPRYAVLVYEAGSALPARKVWIGALAPDTFSRYALLEPGGEVVTIAAYHVERLAERLAQDHRRGAPSKPH